MATFTITPRGSFSLQESALFGFGQRHDTAYDGAMRLAFCLDGTFEPVGVTLRQEADGTLRGVGDLAAREQTARVLSLDVNGEGFYEVSDPVIRRLQAAAPGLRPPLFYSAYEAAAWCVLSARKPGRQMQHVRAALSRQHGTIMTLGGTELAAFPTPAALLAVREFPGLDAVKISRLHGIARAAVDGLLDTTALRALHPTEAMAQLQQLVGIGPFSASLVAIRALGHTDLLPDNEPRALALVGDLWGLGRPATPAELQAIGLGWAPWRTWSLVLVRAAASRLALAA